MPERIFMVRFSFRKRINVLLRDHENVRRSLGCQVVEGDTNIILKNLGRGNTSIDDLAKDTILSRHIAITKLNHNAARSAKSRGLGFDRRIRQAFDIRPDRSQLAYDGLI